MEKIIIIGSGCAGLTAAIYAARANLSPLVIEGKMPGGQITTTSDVENFPGFPEGIDGFSLVLNMRQQAEKFGTRFESDLIVDVDFSSSPKKLIAESGKIYTAKTIIVATGSSSRMTGIPGEKEFWGGNGVSTCATCDGAFYRGKDIVVIGGGDSACEEANFLTRFANKVYLIHRRDTFRASNIMVKRVQENPKIEIILNTIPTEILGDEKGKVKAIQIKNTQTGNISELDVKGIFIAIGHIPNTGFLKDSLPKEADGTLISKDSSSVRTTVPGVFIAGDCADTTYKQAISAAGMGCRAALEAQHYIETAE